MNKKITGNDIASMFDDMGGRKGIVKWAKTNIHTRSQFYSIFAEPFRRLLAGGSDAPRVAENPQEFAALSERCLIGAIDACYRGDQTGSTIIDDDGGEIHDFRSSGVQDANHSDAGAAKPNDALTLHLSEATNDIPRHSSHGKPNTPQPPVDDGITKPPRPDAVQHAVEPELTPAEARARALGPPNPPVSEGPSSTQLFYEWSGSARPTWSPPRSWGGW
jgi:hypothetical protein